MPGYCIGGARTAPSSNAVYDWLCNISHETTEAVTTPQTKNRLGPRMLFFRGAGVADAIYPRYPAVPIRFNTLEAIVHCNRIRDSCTTNIFASARKYKMLKDWNIFRRSRAARFGEIFLAELGSGKVRPRSGLLQARERPTLTGKSLGR